MTPERIRAAAQILGELGNGRMANELEALAESQAHSFAVGQQQKRILTGKNIEIQGLQKQVDVLRGALVDLLEAVKSEPAMNEMKYDSLGLQVHKALAFDAKQASTRG